MRQLPHASYQRLRRATRDLLRVCGGCNAAAAVTRLSKTQLHDCGNPDKTASIPLDVVADLEAECGKPVVSQVLLDLHAEGAEPHSVGDPLERVTALFKEASEGANEYRAYHESPSPNAANQALIELQEVRDAVDALMRDIEADQERVANLNVRRAG